STNASTARVARSASYASRAARTSLVTASRRDRIHRSSRLRPEPSATPDPALGSHPSVAARARKKRRWFRGGGREGGTTGCRARGMPLERLPARNGAVTQLVAAADHLPRLAVLAHPDRQRQAVVALLADHPIAHVSEPVELALLQADPFGQPVDLARDFGDRL